jgi:hypothetical protein
VLFLGGVVTCNQTKHKTWAMVARRVLLWQQQAQLEDVMTVVFNGPVNVAIALS